MIETTTYRPVAWSAPLDDDLAPDGVLLESEDHYLAAWTMLLNGKREIVALQLHPKGEALDLGWLESETEKVALRLPEEPRPISTILVRRIPLGQVMTMREEALAGSEGRPELPDYLTRIALADYLNITERELEYVFDAWVYADAIDRGSAHPAAAVAQVRGIGSRSANNRIGKARQLGYLEPVTQGKISGVLTEKAESLINMIHFVDGDSDE